MSASLSRNDPCPCGSGRKYKACCGRLAPATRGAEPPSVDARSAELGRLAALMDAGRYAELEVAAREVLEMQPNAGFVWQLLAVALGKQGKDALQTLARAAQCLPDDAVAHLNLGNALGRSGRLKEASASYAQALAIRPDFAEAHSNLSDVQLELGQLDEAVGSCRRALEAKPAYAEAHQNLGKVLGRLGRFDEAAASCRRALELRPDFAEAHNTLGYALARLARLDDAILSFRRALNIRPDFLSAHTELGTALRLQRRTEESEASCRQALELDPDCAAALAVMAELRADAGRFAEAEELFNRVISIDPESSEALAGLARLRRMTAADAAWLAASLRLAEQGLPPAKESSLRYAIGKYFDDLQDFDNAFLNYRRANELAKRSGPSYDRNLMARSVDLVIRSHGPKWFDAARGAASPSPRPVFIVGMLRSGTSLAEQILASHPAVFGAGELTFWGAESAPAIAGAIGGDAPEITMSDATLAGLGNRYLELLQRLSADALRVVDKFAANVLLLGLIHAALPHARIIHMQRNPVDTCLSIYFQRFEAANAYANDLDDLAHYYREYRRVMQHWRGVLPRNAMLDVPYEGLVDDVATWSRRMLNFIGLPWDERCLDFHQTQRTVVTASRWQVRQKISASSVERWRHYEKYLGPLKPLLQADAL
jgi:tetratricopeptide (TPR) repeat protein